MLISGLFYNGPPREIVDSWQAGAFAAVVSQDILAEYYQTWSELSPRFHSFEVGLLRRLLAQSTQVVNTESLAHQVCTDASDDMFLECALAGRCRVIVSGDRQLRAVSGYADIEVLSPREFVDRYL